MRRARLLGISLVMLSAACTGPSPGPPQGDAGDPNGGAEPSPRGRFEEAACSLPQSHLRRVWRGYYPGRSGDVQMVPEEPDFVGAWFSHSGPWRYVQHVPLLFYGPGYVPEGRVVDGTVTLADVAPTYAELLDVPFSAPDGKPLTDAVLPDRDPPKVIVTMVWDSAGRNVLEEHAGRWPTLRRLIERGTWFDEAMVGVSPSVTPAVHAMIGTGAFPRSHGIPDMNLMVEGDFLSARGHGARQLLTPSLADVYSKERDHRPVIALVGSEGTLGMLGRGALAPGGTRHLAVTRTHETWGLELNTDAFRFPEYARDFPGLAEAVRRLDLEDGALDARWHGEEIEEGSEGVSATPAFSEYQRRMVREVIQREPFGQDDVTDLLFINYREIDAVGHRWGMNSRQMKEVVRSTDRALADLIRTLDREVGEGEWVLTVTADHGATPHPNRTGAFIIENAKLAEDLRAAFDPEGSDESILRLLRPTQIWLRQDAMAEAGVTVKEVARFLADYTKGQNRADPTEVPPEERDQPAFGAVFPSTVLETAPCVDFDEGR